MPHKSNRHMLEDDNKKMMSSLKRFSNLQAIIGVVTRSGKGCVGMMTGRLQAGWLGGI